MIEEKVLKKIGYLKCAYREKEDAFQAEEKKLQECVDRYLDESGIRNDAGRLREVAGLLPDSRTKSSLIGHLYGLELKEEERQTLQGGEQGAAAAESGRETGRTAPCGDACHFEGETPGENTLKEMERLAQIYRKKEKAFRAEQKKLREFVEGYLDRNGIKKDAQKLDEVIDVLPGGILRFRLLARKYALMEKEAEQQHVPEKAAEIQEGADGPQMPDGTQAAGMGGIQ